MTRLHCQFASQSLLPLQVRAVPEPTTVTLALFVLLAVWQTRSRRGM